MKTCLPRLITTAFNQSVKSWEFWTLCHKVQEESWVFQVYPLNTPWTVLRWVTLGQWVRLGQYCTFHNSIKQYCISMAFHAVAIPFKLMVWKYKVLDLLVAGDRQVNLEMKDVLSLFILVRRSVCAKTIWKGYCTVLISMQCQSVRRLAVTKQKSPISLAL